MKNLWNSHNTRWLTPGRTTLSYINNIWNRTCHLSLKAALDKALNRRSVRKQEWTEQMKIQMAGDLVKACREEIVKEDIVKVEIKLEWVWEDLVTKCKNKKWCCKTLWTKATQSPKRLPRPSQLASASTVRTPSVTATPTKTILRNNRWKRLRCNPTFLRIDHLTDFITTIMQNLSIEIKITEH